MTCTLKFEYDLKTAILDSTRNNDIMSSLASIYKKAVLSQGEPRDAAVNFDYRYVSNFTIGR